MPKVEDLESGENRSSKSKSWIATYGPGIGIILFVIGVTFVIYYTSGAALVAAPLLRRINSRDNSVTNVTNTVIDTTSTLEKREDNTSSISPPFLAAPVRLNDVTIYDQKQSSITKLRDGFGVIFKDQGLGVVTGIFGPKSEKRTDNFIASDNTGEINDYGNPVIGEIASGIVGAWECPSNLGDICVKLFDINGTALNNQSIIANTFIVNEQSKPSLTTFSGTDKFAVQYTSIGFDQVGYPYVIMDMFNGNTRLTSDIRINSDAGGFTFPGSRRLITLPNNNMLTSWYTTQMVADTSGGCAGQSLSSIGGLIGSQYLYNTATAGIQQNARLDRYSDSGGIAIYESVGNGIYIQNFDNTGAGKVVPEFKIPATTSTSINPSVKVLQDNSILVAWEDSGIIWAQWMARNFSSLSQAFRVAPLSTLGPLTNVDIEQLQDGNIVFKWEGPDGSGTGVFAKVITLSVSPFVYNTDIPINCLESNGIENNECSVTQLYVNGVVSTTYTQLTLDPQIATLTFKPPLPSGVNVTQDENTGTATIEGPSPSVEDTLLRLSLVPKPYVVANTTLTIAASTDSTITPTFTAEVPVKVTAVNYSPNLTVNPMLVEQNQPFVLTPNFFNASNPDPNVNREIRYVIDSPLHATFYNTQTGLQILTFSHDELAQGIIQIVPDDSGFAPSFFVTATDTVTGLSSSKIAANIVFYPRPVIEALGPFDVSSDKTFTFTEQTLNATSSSSQTGSLWKLFDIRNSDIVGANGNALIADDTGTVTFSREEVLIGQIGIKPDGSSNSPSLNALFCVPTQSVTDNFLCSRQRSALFNFNFVVPPQSNNPTAKNNIPLIAGLVAGLSFAALLGVGGGVFACYRHSKNKKLMDSRASISSLADWVRTYLKEKARLKLNNIKDFSTGDGADFVTYIGEIQNHVNQNSVNEDEIKNLADNIAEAISDKIGTGTDNIQTKSGEFVNLQDLRSYASAIATSADQKSRQFEVASL